MCQIDILGNAVTDDKGKFARLSFNGVAIPPNIMAKIQDAERVLKVDRQTLIRLMIYSWVEACAKTCKEME